MQQAPTALVEDLKRRFDGLKSSTERAQCEGHWEELADYMRQRNVGFSGRRTAGEKGMTKVFDPTGIHAVELLASGLHGLATNPSTKWFSLRIIGTKVQMDDGRFVDVNEVPEVQQYLSDVDNILWQRVYQPGSNATSALHEFYLDLATFGTAILFLGQRDDGGLLFEARSLTEIVIAENQDGAVDTVMRTFEMTVRQLVQMSKLNEWKPSDHVKDLYANGKYDDKIKIVHAVYPRADGQRDPTKKGQQDMPFASVYFEHDSAQKLHEGGFPEMPYLVARWSKYAGETYGRSPAMTALPDVKMLQAEALTLIKLLQKAADPPLAMRHDGVVGGVRAIPGGITYWRGNPSEGIMPMPVSLQGLQPLVQHIQTVQQQIMRTCYADILRQLGAIDRQMTAFEVAQRQAETMRLLGPLVGRLEGELLGPMIGRIFGILTRLNLLPPAPEIIQGQEFSVEYVSQIASAQKQISAQGLVQAAQVIIGMVGPEMAAQVLAKRVDPNKVVDYVWDLFNNDPDLLLDQEAQQQADQMAQLQQALQAGQPMADIAQKVGGAVKNLAGSTKDASQAQALGGLDVGALTQAAVDGASDPRGRQRGREMVEGMMNGTAA